MPRLAYHGTVRTPPQAPEAPLSQDWQVVLLNELNEVRRACGLPERTMADVATAVAQRQAARQAEGERAI